MTYNDEQIYTLLTESTDEYISAVEVFYYGDQGITPRDSTIEVTVGTDKPYQQSHDNDLREREYHIFIYKKGLNYQETRNHLRNLTTAVKAVLRDYYGEHIHIGAVTPIGDGILQGMELIVSFYEEDDYLASEDEYPVDVDITPDLTSTPTMVDVVSGDGTLTEREEEEEEDEDKIYI